MACLIAVAFPGSLGVGQRITPLILGLPPSFAWNVLWVFLSFVAVLAYHLSGKTG